MMQPPKLDARLIIIPHDGGNNPRNPYDRFTPEERKKKIVGLCARVYLRIRSKDSDQTNPEPGIASSETPAPAASDPQSESEAASDAR